MDKIYEYVRHPRAAELALKGPTKTTDIRNVNHQNPIVRFNAIFGLKITLIVGTMWAAYIFTILRVLRRARRDQAGHVFRHRVALE